MEVRKPNIETHGPVATHDQACCVYHEHLEHAVLNLSTGVFEPSWRAQHHGYHLVHANNPFKRWLVKVFFK